MVRIDVRNSRRGKRSDGPNEREPRPDHLCLLPFAALAFSCAFLIGRLTVSGVRRMESLNGQSRKRGGDSPPIFSKTESVELFISISEDNNNNSWRTYRQRSIHWVGSSLFSLLRCSSRIHTRMLDPCTVPRVYGEIQDLSMRNVTIVLSQIGKVNTAPVTTSLPYD